MEINNKTEKMEYKYEGAVVLKTDITVPNFKGLSQSAMKRLNGFYNYLCKQEEKYARRVLLPMAVKDYKNAKENNYPTHIYELLLVYTVTHSSATDEKLSLYYDIYEYTGGAHGITVRYADNFSLKTGLPLPPLITKVNKKAVIKDCTCQAIAIQESGNGVFFENIPKNMKKYFKANQSNITDRGIRVFYQLYTIAPYYMGIVSVDIND